MAVELKIPTKNGLRLHTKNKFIEDDIDVTLDDSLIPSGTLEVTENGEHDVATYEKVNVNVESSGDSLKKLLDATKSCYYLFKNFNGTSVDDLIKYEDTENVIDMYYMFYNCLNLTTIPLLDTSNVIDMQSMFNGCKLLTTIPQLDTSKVTNMQSMFFGCSALTEIPLINTSKVTSMTSMFNGCKLLTTIPLLDTSKVTSMNSMFNGCSSLTTIPLLDTSSVTNMQSMFSQCLKLTTIPLLDTSKVTNMQSMFSGCKLLTEIPLLDTSNINSLYNTFGSCSELTTIPALNVSNVTGMNNTFNSMSKLKKIEMYGMKVAFNISSSTQFEASDLVTIISNCQVVTSSKTLTMGSTNLAKLENVYVKETGVELYEGITCHPCVICESTDGGAMLVTTYASNKGWTLA